MSPGAFIVRRWTGQHDYSIPDRHFSVRKPPIGRREASCLRESKHFRQPFQGGNAVLIGQIRNHVWHLVLLIFSSSISGTTRPENGNRTKFRVVSRIVFTTAAAYEVQSAEMY